MPGSMLISPSALLLEMWRIYTKYKLQWSKHAFTLLTQFTQSQASGALLSMLWLVFECAALQMLRDDTPTLFQGVHSMRCFVWQDVMVLMSRFVRDAMRMVRAASSGDELDV